MAVARARTRRKGKANEEAAPEPSSDNTATPAQAQQMPAYAVGQGAVAGVPLLDDQPAQAAPLEDQQSEPRQKEVIPDREQGQEDRKPETKAAAEQEEVSDQTAAPVSDVSGEGEELHATAYAVTLRGRTDANFTSSFSTQDVVTTAGRGCNGCARGDCVHVRGTLASTYTVTTSVTLPSVNDFPDLTPCQRQRVQDGITNVLAPHEQQHVSAFSTYNGTTQQPFDMTICRGAFDAAMQSMHNSEQRARQAAAQARSDALDPFQFDVDLNCQEPDAGAPRAPDAGTPAPRGAATETPTVGPNQR
jgi:hypothetical protein